MSNPLRIFGAVPPAPGIASAPQAAATPLADSVDNARPTSMVASTSPLPAPTAQRPAAVAKSGAVAMVGNVAISEQDVAREMDTLGLAATLFGVTQKFAAHWHIAPVDGETPEEFAARVQDVADATNTRHTLDAARDDAADRLAMRTTVLLVDHANLMQLAAGLSVPQALTLEDQNQALKTAILQARAATKKIPLDDPALARALSAELNQALDDALWKPYASALDKALGSQPPEARAEARQFLTALYVDRFSLRAARSIADELGRGGNAAKLCALIKASGDTTWTVASLRVLAASTPSLAPSIRQWLAPLTGSGDDKVVFALDAHGLHLVPAERALESQNRTFAALTQRSLALCWVKKGSALVLALADEKNAGAAIPQADRVQALGVLQNRFVTLLAQAQKALLAGTPDLPALVHDSGLDRFTDQPLALLLDAGLRADLSRLALAAAGDGMTPKALGRRFAALKIPDAEQTAPLAEASRFALITQAVGPLTPALSALLKDDAAPPCDLPLVVGARLSESTTTLVAMLQRLLMASGLLPDAARIGALDNETVTVLRRVLGDSDTQTSLHIDADKMRALVGALLGTFNPETIFVGDWIAHHPALIDHRARGGSQSAVSLVWAYLRAQGFALPTPAVVDAAFVRAMNATLHLPLDSAALTTAEACLARDPPAAQSDAALSEIFAQKLARIGDKLFWLGPATDSERRTLSARMTAATIPRALRSVTRSNFGGMAVHEPIVALKCALAQLLHVPPPVQSDGIIDGTLDEATLLSLRDVLFPKGDAAPLYGAFSRVATAVSTGELVLANLGEELSADSSLGRDANLVLRTVGEMAQSVRVNIAPTTGASVAVAEQHRRYAPVSQSSRPLRLAQALLRGATGDDHAIARMTATDVDALFANASPALAEREAADLTRVRAALVAGKLAVSEGLIETTPLDASLEASARFFVERYLAAADAKQQTSARADALSAELRGAAWAAAHHLFVLPGFSDDVPSNAAYDWMVVAQKNELSLLDQPKARAQLAEVNGALSVVDDSDKTNAALARLQATQIDAPFIRALIDTSKALLGKSNAETAIAGTPERLLSNARAIDLLTRIADDMQAGRRDAFACLSITLTDSDPDVRMAKQLIQSALLRRFQQHAENRDLAAVQGLIDHALARAPAIDPAFVRGFLLTNGLLAAHGASGIHDDALTPDELRACAAAGVLALDASDANSFARLSSAAARLLALSKNGSSLKVSGSGPDREALQTILDATAKKLDTGSAFSHLDLDAQLAKVSGALRVSAPLHNLLSAQGGKAAPLGAMSWTLAQAASPEDVRRAAAKDWLSHTELDPRRAVETTLGSFVLFRHLMHSIISYDLSVAPARQAERALSKWWHAGNAEERAAALDELVATGSGLLDTLASFTAYHTPIGFIQDLGHEVVEGHLDVALGKAPVLVPLIWASTHALVNIGKRLWRRANHRSGGYEVIGATRRNVRIIATSEVGLPNAVQAAAGATAEGLGVIKDALRDPKGSAGSDFRAAVDKLGPRRTLTLKGDAAFSFELPAAERAFVAENPDGSIALSLEKNNAVTTLELRNSDLLELAAAPENKISRALIERMGIDGPDRAAIVKGLRTMCEGLAPRVAGAAQAPLPTLRTLSMQRAFSTFEVTLDAHVHVVRIPNSVLIKLLHDRAHGQTAAYEDGLRGAGLWGERQAVNTIATAYRNAPLALLDAANRRALVGDALQRFRFSLARKGAFLRRLLPAAKAPEVTTAMPSANAAAPAQSEVSVGWSERSAALRGEAESYVAELKTAFANDGLTGLSARVAKGVGGWAIEQAKSPTLYLVIAYSGRELLLDFNRIKAQTGLSPAEVSKKIRQAVLERGGALVGNLVIGAVVFSFFERLFPHLIGSAGAAGTLFGLATLSPFLIDLEQGLDATRGYLPPDDALALWQQLGIAETAFLKFDPALYPDAADHNALAHSDLTINSLRTKQVWYSRQSTLADRLRQLCPQSTAGIQLKQRPRDFKPELVHTFQEPLARRLEQLRGLPARKDVGQVPEIANFDYDAWLKKTASAAEDIVRSVTLEDGSQRLDLDHLDLDKLAALLGGEDQFDHPSPAQAQVLARRISVEARQSYAWLKLLASLNLPDAKTQALLYVEGLAAQHRLGSMMYKYAAILQSKETWLDRAFVAIGNAGLAAGMTTGSARMDVPRWLDTTSEIDDFFLMADALR